MPEAHSLDHAHQVLQDVWGYESFRPLQEQSIGSILESQDSLTVLPTGGGKSLCFQVPALCKPGLAIVVSPLISLMKDQVDGLKACGVSAAFVNSTQNASEQRAVAQDIHDGRLKLLYVAPERLVTQKMLDYLMNVEVSFFAIDEAHCVSAWGHDFRPEYRELQVLKKRFPHASVHAFTATASEKVREDIAEQLQLESPDYFVGSFDRPNLTYRMLRSNGRLNQVCELIRKHPGESGIVYCISRKEVERTANAISALGIDALPYHAGMTDEDRKANQESFINERIDVIVATVAFGMGIDKSNVRFVIHSGMPKSVENYQQESGRAGRDGLESECVLIYSGGDIVTWKKIMENPQSPPDPAALRSLEAMYDLCTGVVCRHRSIVEYFGQHYAAENCGACDVCLGEIDTVEDPVTIGQKILSCVLRLQERFGAGHTAKVLAGSREARILEFGHDQLSTYGLLSDDGQTAAKAWIEQMVSQGFLARGTGEFQTLSVTESGRRLLKRDGTLHLTKPPKNRAKQSSRSTTEVSWNGVDRELFEKLRSLRSRLAAARSVPAYIIFGDAPLREMACIRPSTMEAFARVRGVGSQKLADFGETFVATIKEYCAHHNVATDQPASITAEPDQERTKLAIKSSSVGAFELFRAGKSIEEVGILLNRARSTTTGYLADFIRHDQITDPSPWVDEATVRRIDSAIHLSEDNRLKPIFDGLNGEVSYDEIKIVLNCRNNIDDRMADKEVES